MTGSKDSPMPDVLHIKPEPGRRVAFARWAVAQTPKIRTVGLHVFGVPAALFVAAPEDILIGALVNGHRYVSPVEDAAEGRPAPGTPEPGGDDQAPVPAAAEQSAGEPAPEPDADEVSDGPEAADDADNLDPPFLCAECARDFPTSRGLTAHRRQAHPEA